MAQTRRKLSRRSYLDKETSNISDNNSLDSDSLYSNNRRIYKRKLKRAII